MKNKKIKILAIIVLIIMLIPIPIKIKDGGSIKYKAVAYQITKVYRLAETNDIENGYDHYEGIEITIFGLEVYNNTKLVKKQH